MRGKLRLWAPVLAGSVLFILGLGTIIGGYVSLHGWQSSYIVNDLYANVGVGFVGIAIVVLVIDSLNRGRFEELRRGQVIRDMASRDNGRALSAIAELRSSGWLTDGSLDLGQFSRADLSSAGMERVRARGASFSGATLVGSDLAEGDLRGAKFNRAELCRANLERSNLSNCQLFGADLSNADCGYADFSEASLVEGVLTGADFRGADLRKCNLAGVDLTDVNLAGAKIGGALIDADTVLPPGAPQAPLEGHVGAWPVDTVWPVETEK